MVHMIEGKETSAECSEQDQQPKLQKVK